MSDFNKWMSTIGLNVIRHANCCRIAFDAGSELQQAEINQLKAKNTQLTHALVNANAEKSKWQKDYWSQVERSAEYGAMLMTDPDSLEFKCCQKEKQIEELTKQLTLCREENKGLVGKVSELKKHSEMLIDAANSWTYSEGEKNILLSQADDLDRILDGEKALQGETTPEPKWKTIKVVCQRCGHYLNGCHCNHFGDQCPHLNTSKFGDDGLAECFNCNKIINKDREVVGGADDINLTR